MAAALSCGLYVDGSWPALCISNAKTDALAGLERFSAICDLGGVQEQILLAVVLDKPVSLATTVPFDLALSATGQSIQCATGGTAPWFFGAFLFAALLLASIEEAIATALAAQNRVLGYHNVPLPSFRHADETMKGIVRGRSA